MNRMKDNVRIKLIVIISLIVLMIILFYVYVSIDGSSENKTGIQKTNPPSKEKIIKDIDSIIFTFGIKKEWIRNVNAKDLKNRQEQTSNTKEVLIPTDLPTIDLNYEISNYLKSNNFDNKVTEDPKSKNIVMSIFYSPDSLKNQIGNIKFIYSDSVKRNAAEVCIVLDSLDSYNLSDVEKILTSTQEFSVFLPLRNDKADYQSMIMDLKKDYLIKFSVGGEDDIEADFKEDMKENVWKSKIKSVVLNFPQASGIILSGSGGLNDFENMIQDEFVKNNLNVYRDSIFVQFVQLKRTENEITSLFDDIISKSKSGRKFLIYDVNFNPVEFSDYDREVYTMKKLGYRFFDFKELMNRVTKDKDKEKIKADDTK
jgi:hypothetical protein